ncbi:hypothetical protein [Bovifimicola ammoniilytica]|jgi:hypothetical protein|uniref:hypothetical protein n=1 Tax=Bovifimicola ammoniilytica TaxID=2981720 RepID=UPI000820E132|nr:hypothetical protein [Bovifimicola ammoniilytica]MCU6754501.1 hypothetical protein [Bovifimicola ammoniilytica]SCJ86028.1 Uncharacterised protein [uncultured Eubacterium sp.]
MSNNKDWRLQKNVEYLKSVDLNPTDGEEIVNNAPHLKQCIFCLDKVMNSPYQRWFVTIDCACCICENCYSDFNEIFEWKTLDGWDIEWKN